jgi:5-methylcytosine-specific restriction protein A
MALHPCYQPGCPNLINKGGYCIEHQRQTTRQYNQYVRDPDIQRLYNSTRWKHERKIFLDKHPLCECEECKANDRTISATMVDHKIPHKGDLKLFWDKSNWQAMSLEHHNAKTKKEQGYV